MNIAALVLALWAAVLEHMTFLIALPPRADVPWQDRTDFAQWEPPLPPGMDGWPTEPPSRWSDLRPELELPPSVTAGARVDYVIVLRNISDEPVDLRPCGGYRQEVEQVGAGMAPEPVAGGSTSYRLNCDADPILAPGEERRYAMRLRVPEGVDGDEVLIRWTFVDDMPDYGAQWWVPLA